jgi:hypothetical protein
LFAGVSELLAAVAARSPSGVAFVVEDVHWADNATLDFLTFQARAGRRDGVRVVVTCRGDEAPLTAHVAGWLAQMQGSAGVEEIRLLPLSRAQVAEQVAALAARRAADPGALAAVLDARLYALWDPGGAQDRLAAGSEIIGLARAAGDDRRERQGQFWRFVALMELGRVGEAESALAAFGREAAAAGDTEATVQVTARHAMLAIVRGRFDDARRLTEAGAQPERPGGRRGRPEWHRRFRSGLGVSPPRPADRRTAGHDRAAGAPGSAGR